MTTSKRRTRKLRGHVSHGGGRIGKNRKHPGGRGNAGGQHHMRIWFDKFHPGYFGKIGQRNFNKNKNLDFCPTVNVDSLWSLVGQDAYEKAKADQSKAVVIDVTRHGYFKVLGRGQLPKVPVIVRARFFSQLAIRRIEEIGGICELSSSPSPGK